MDATSRPVLRYADGGWAEAIGGHLALELVNTVSWRLDPARTVERLPDGAAVARWAEFVGLEGVEPPSDRVLAEVRRLRERIYRVVRPLAVGEQAAPGDVETLRRALLRVVARAEVVSVLPLELAADDLVGRLSLAAWALLEREDSRRLRECAASGCGWLFLDRTKNGSRVWCSSADCGNRTRARRHYARRTERP